MASAEITLDVEVLGILKVGDKWYLISENPAVEITQDHVKEVLNNLRREVEAAHGTR